MAEQLLPKFSSKPAYLTNDISVACQNGMVVYFVGLLPIFSHAEKDIASFKMITSSLYMNNHITQIQIADFFEVSIRGVKRACKQFKEFGAGSFHRKPSPRKRQATIFTDEFVEIVQEMFEEGFTKEEIATKYNVKIDTFNKAIRDGRIIVKKKNMQSPI